MKRQRKCALIGACLGAALSATMPPASAAAETSDLIVILDPSVDQAQFAREHGLAIKGGLAAMRDRAGEADKQNALTIFSAKSAAAAKAIEQAAQNDPRVKLAFVDRPTTFAPAAFSPNDPYFPNNSPNASFRGQWHLENQIVAGRDARLRGAWDNDWTGLGVTIGIVDDGMQTTHPDLAPNLSAYSYDFRFNDSNPSPSGSNNHGTAVAGVAAARGGNGIGVTGAAPHASLAGLRVSFEADQTLAMFVNAALHESFGSTQNIQVKNHSYSENVPWVDDTPIRIANSISAAAGTINVFAAGNFRGTAAQDSNKLMLQNNPDVITVAAMDSTGVFASYSNFGSCVFVTAPSNDFGAYGITTTDRTGSNGYNSGADMAGDANYTSTFGGTSSAAPVVSGVMALGKQVQPSMDTRMAKHLLVLSSDQIDAAAGGWSTNGAGFKFSQNYGFGLIDAGEFTQLAGTYAGVSPLQTESIGTTPVNAAIPDNSTVGLSRTFNITSSTPLEEMLVTLDISHLSRGQLEAFLISPMNTTSRLFSVSTLDTGDHIVDWQFTTNQFWGENPLGTWTLQVRDRAAGTIGTWNDFSVTARMGFLVVPEPGGIAGVLLLGMLATRRRRRSV